MPLKWGYDELRTLVALPDAGARRELRKSLQGEGMLHCREVAELPVLAERLSKADVDLLVTTLNDRGWDSGEMIRQIRSGALGTNPFMIIIVLLDKPSPWAVNRVVNGGADDLLLSPWLGRLVTDRLDGFAQGRKPFLVTHNYIGPERRNIHRDDIGPPPLIDVPNPVLWLHAGNDDREDFRRQIRNAQAQVNLLKIKSCGGQLRFLADRIVESFPRGGQEAILPFVKSLLDASDEMMRRAADTDFAPAIELTNSLRTLCMRLSRENRTPRQDEISVLPSLAAAVVNALYWNEQDPLPAVLLQ